jgi:hypothetical protein
MRLDWRKSLIGPLLACAFCLPGTVSGQSTGTKTSPRVNLATPCCGVVAVSLKDSVVTARETASGYTFKFKVTDRKLLAEVKVGDRVWADFTRKQVRLRATDATPCCAILPTLSGPGRGGI